MIFFSCRPLVALKQQILEICQMISRICINILKNDIWWEMEKEKKNFKKIQTPEFFVIFLSNLINILLPFFLIYKKSETDNKLLQDFPWLRWMHVQILQQLTRHREKALNLLNTNISTTKAVVEGRGGFLTKWKLLQKSAIENM